MFCFSVTQSAFRFPYVEVTVIQAVCSVHYFWPDSSGVLTKLTGEILNLSDISVILSKR